MEPLSDSPWKVAGYLPDTEAVRELLDLSLDPHGLGPILGVREISGEAATLRHRTDL